MKKRSKFKNKNIWFEKFEKYQNEEFSKSEAERKANNKMQETILLHFLTYMKKKTIWTCET